MANVFKVCKDCVPPKRHLGCHDHCPEHLAEVEENKRIKAKEREFYESDRYMTDIIHKKRNRLAKERKRRPGGGKMIHK